MSHALPGGGAYCQYRKKKGRIYTILKSTQVPNIFILCKCYLILIKFSITVQIRTKKLRTWVFMQKFIYLSQVHESIERRWSDPLGYATASIYHIFVLLQFPQYEFRCMWFEKNKKFDIFHYHYKLSTKKKPKYNIFKVLDEKSYFSQNIFVKFLR